MSFSTLANEAVLTTRVDSVDWQLTWNVISEVAALSTALKGEIVPVEHGGRAYVERIPYGVVFAIARELYIASWCCSH